jgi:anti-sigma-K factor RskA
MTHEPFETLAAVYAVGALDGEDRRHFEAHLAEGCQECAAAVRDSHEALAALAREAPRAIPPAHVKETLLRRIGEQPASAPRASKAPARWRWLLGGAVAAVIVAGFTAGFVAARYEARLGHMARETMVIRERLRQEEARLASTRDVVELLGDPTTRVVTLEGQGPAPQARARVVWNDRRGGHLFVSNVPPPPAGKTYELWTIGSGAPRPAGLFGVSPSGAGTLRVEPAAVAEPVKVFAVTLEPAGGTPAPTGPMILASK